jgi:hypothetical protein
MFQTFKKKLALITQNVNVSHVVRELFSKTNFGVAEFCGVNEPVTNSWLI